LQNATVSKSVDIKAFILRRGIRMKELVYRYNNQEIVSGGPTILCGIVNVTPDSFSDGGKWFGKEEAVKHALELVEQGAGMLDIGGESTRPGSTYVEIQEEIDRIVPVIKEIKKQTDVPVSVDTWKAEVAKAAIEAGADIINDITGLIGDPEMAKVLGNSEAGLILMFNPVIARPDHKSAKNFPSFGGDGVFTQEEIETMNAMKIEDAMVYYFNKALSLATEAGIPKDRIQLDPGIGFGLTKKENLSLIKNMDLIHRKGYQIFLGVSRKRFIVNMLSDAGFNMEKESEAGLNNRDIGSAVLTAIAARQGVEVVRVHVIPEHKLAATIADSVRLADDMENTSFDGYNK